MVIEQPLMLIHGHLKDYARLEIWLNDDKFRLEGYIIGFDDSYDIVLDDAVKIIMKDGVRYKRKPLGRIMVTGCHVALVRKIEMPSATEVEADRPSEPSTSAGGSSEPHQSTSSASPSKPSSSGHRRKRQKVTVDDQPN